MASVSLLSYTRYVLLTGDETTAASAVEFNLDLAEREVARVLRRPLAYGEHTERVAVHRFGRAYPHATPVVSVAASATYNVEDTTTLRYVSRDDLSGSPLGFADFGEWSDAGGNDGYPELYGYATITYEGGWTLDDDPLGTQVPLPVERAIAWVTNAMLSPASFAGTAASNIKSASLGGVSVTYKDAQSSGSLDDYWPGAVRSIIGFRYKDGVG